MQYGIVNGKVRGYPKKLYYPGENIKFYIFTSENIKYALYFINIFLYFTTLYIIKKHIHVSKVFTMHAGLGHQTRGVLECLASMNQTKLPQPAYRTWFAMQN